jgi:uncharacterized protein (DUF2141 family)
MRLRAVSAILVALAAAPVAACGIDGPAAIVEAHGFKDRRGNLRIAVYRATNADFLVSGRYAARVDVPLTPAGPMHVCVAVPGPGAYAVSALHDRNADGRLNPFADGAGFANNPRLGLRKPDLADVTVNIDGPVRLAIRMHYLKGLRPQPIKAD